MKIKFIIIIINLSLIFSTKFTGPVTNYDVIYLNSSKEYLTSEVKATNSYDAGDELYNDISIYWKDISSGISAKNEALGFVDVLVSVTIKDIPGISNKWYMYGDIDRIDDQDMRAWCDNALYEMIDTAYKADLAKNESYSTHPFIPYTTSSALSEDFTVLRFKVPEKVYGPYKIFIGRNIIGPYLYNTGRGYSYQVNLYTPILKNKVFPVVKIQYPETFGSFTNEYSEDLKKKSIPEHIYNVTINSPIKFTAENTLNESSYSISDMSGILKVLSIIQKKLHIFFITKEQ